MATIKPTSKPSAKVYCVVVRDATNSLAPRCIGKTRSDGQAALWKQNLIMALMDVGVYGKLLVFIMNELELLAAIREHAAAQPAPTAETPDYGDHPYGSF